MTRVYVLFGVVAGDIASRVPSFFRPDIIDPETRLTAFTTTMGWRQPTEEKFADIQPRISHLSYLLADARAEMADALQREDLLPSERADALTDSEVYWDFFAQLPNKVFPVLLEEAPPTLDVLYKAVMVAATGKEYLEMLPELCTVIKAKLASQPRWQSVCRGDVPVEIFRTLTPQELYLVLKWRGSRDHFMFQVLGGERASEELIEAIDAIPTVVSPLARAICLSIRVAYFCQKVIDAWEAVSPVSAEVLDQLEIIKATVDTVDSFPDSSLTFEYDYVISTPPLRLERGLVVSARSHPTWPLLSRLLMASTRAEQIAEFTFATSGGLTDFLAAVDAICYANYQRFSRCWGREYAGIPAGVVVELVKTPMLAEVIATRYLNFYPGNVVGWFVERRSLRGVRGECDICDEAFSRSYAVNLCKADGEFSGQYMCRKCAKWFSNNKIFTCPFCRKVLAASPATEAFLEGSTESVGRSTVVVVTLARIVAFALLSAYGLFIFTLVSLFRSYL